MSRFSQSFLMWSIGAFFTALLIGFLEILGALWWFGIPFVLFLLSIVGVLLTRASRKAKGWVIAICILTIPVTAFTFMRLRTASPEFILIPSHYRGEFVVFYGQPCGEALSDEGGSRVYRVPPSGVLITSAAENRGYINRRFFLFDAAGARIEIPAFQWQRFDTESKYWNASRFGELRRDTVGVFWPFGRRTYEVSRDSFGYIVADSGYYDRPVRESEMDAIAVRDRAATILSDCFSR